MEHINGLFMCHHGAFYYMVIIIGSSVLALSGKDIYKILKDCKRRRIRRFRLKEITDGRAYKSSGAAS